ncbi:MAG: hypothetical protein IKF68_04535 [Erysipelotrichaceae bacterium]|nr:hypothetical protein [Erysipelotrichaceae bacterium]
MKKVLTLLLCLLCLVACSGQETPEGDTETVEEPVAYSFVAPSGAPALSLLEIIDDENMTFDIVEGADVLQAEFTNGNADVIIAPVNLGAKLASATGNYKLAAVLTWGNLHLVSTVSEEEAAMNPVAAFGEAAVPGKVLGFLSDSLGAYEMEWFESVNEASSALLSGEYKSAVLAEPILTMTRGKYEGELTELVNIQDLYKEVTGYASYPQAALFVKTTDTEEPEKLNAVLDRIASSISLYNSDSDALAARIDEVDMSVMGFANGELIKKAYSRMALNYVAARECKDEIRTFLGLFGMELDESIVLE